MAEQRKPSKDKKARLLDFCHYCPGICKRLRTRNILTASRRTRCRRQTQSPRRSPPPSPLRRCWSTRSLCRGACRAAADATHAGSWRNWIIRGVTTWLMLFAFAGIIYMGHMALAVLVILLQLKSFHEIISIGYVKYKEQKLPWFRTLNWSGRVALRCHNPYRYFLFCTNYFMYFEGFGHYFLQFSAAGVCCARRHPLTHFVMAGPCTRARHSPPLRVLQPVHCWCDGCLPPPVSHLPGFVAFVLTLKRGYYKFQMSQVGYTPCFWSRRHTCSLAGRTWHCWPSWYSRSSSSKTSTPA